MTLQKNKSCIPDIHFPPYTGVNTYFIGLDFSFQLGAAATINLFLGQITEKSPSEDIYDGAIEAILLRGGRLATPWGV